MNTNRLLSDIFTPLQKMTGGGTKLDGWMMLEQSDLITGHQRDEMSCVLSECNIMKLFSQETNLGSHILQLDFYS